MKMKLYLTGKMLIAKTRTKDFIKNLVTTEDGDTNFISIILIAVVVIGIAAIFKEKLIALVGDVFDKLTSFVSTGDTPYGGGE